MKAYIDPERCAHCEKCYSAKACPVNAIFCISKEEPYIVETNLCHGCGDCVAKCPANSVELKNG